MSGARQPANAKILARHKSPLRAITKFIPGSILAGHKKGFGEQLPFLSVGIKNRRVSSTKRMKPQTPRRDRIRMSPCN